MHKHLIFSSWSKGSRGSVIATAGPGGVEYYDDYCTGNSSCSTSSKGVLNPTTGILTIFATELGDEDSYYYNMNKTSGGPDPGLDFEILLVVYGMNFPYKFRLNIIVWLIDYP